MQAQNLYVHFPFCRRKCAYCALHSRAGVSETTRAVYVARLARELSGTDCPCRSLSTVYFGGGSPALCDLRPLFEALAPKLADDAEFTVELHPLDITPSLLTTLRAGGVNRISMGLQSLDDATLADMGRGYTVEAARRAFEQVKRTFENAGLDLIVGYETKAECERLDSLSDWGLAHCSVYSLQLEEGTLLARRVREGRVLPSDDIVLDRIRQIAQTLAGQGLERYEISNYARRGYACRHNLAVWRGEDYLGLGEGAAGRIGRLRTKDLVSLADLETRNPATVTVVDGDEDELERTIFRLRTREGLDSSRHPEWRERLDRFVTEGVLAHVDGSTRYILTPRGTEVCDTVLAELV